MSKADNQSITMLLVIISCMAAVQRANSFARVDIKEAVAEAKEAAEKVVHQWPVMGNDRKIAAWVHSRLLGWELLFEEGTLKIEGVPAVTAICELILTDLEDRIKNTHKLKLLKSIGDKLYVIRQFVDAEGRHFPSYEDADKALVELKELVEW